MNVHAVEVERIAGRPLMSGFHALFSIGGFAGSTLMTVLLAVQLPSTLLSTTIMLVLTLIAWPRLLRRWVEGGCENSSPMGAHRPGAQWAWRRNYEI